MAFVTANDRSNFVAAAEPASKAKTPGLIARLFAALVEARQHAAEHEVRAYLEDRGQFLTDEAERQIERILSARGGL